MTYGQKCVLIILIQLLFLIIKFEAQEAHSGQLTEKDPSSADNELSPLISEYNGYNEIGEGDMDGYDSSDSEYEGFIGGTSRKQRKQSQESNELKKGPKMWDHWGKWGACSVSCGIGKITRWRHCVSGGCASGEKEAQIKTCTLPAC